MNFGENPLKISNDLEERVRLALGPKFKSKARLVRAQVLAVAAAGRYEGCPNGYYKDNPLETSILEPGPKSGDLNSGEVAVLLKYAFPRGGEQRYCYIVNTRTRKVRFTHKFGGRDIYSEQVY